ncbi:hypothetical protein CDL15_Pgr001187 [Punica granatum]|nr:hypothetical protein CDL15_Pgr001187 [Punica granatum]
MAWRKYSQPREQPDNGGASGLTGIEGTTTISAPNSTKEKAIWSPQVSRYDTIAITFYYASILYRRGKGRRIEEKGEGRRKSPLPGGRGQPQLSIGGGIDARRARPVPDVPVKRSGPRVLLLGA